MWWSIRIRRAQITPIGIQEFSSVLKDRRDLWSQTNWDMVGSTMAVFGEHVYEEGFDQWTKAITQLIHNCTEQFPANRGNIPPWWGVVTRRLLALKRYYHQKAVRLCLVELWCKYKLYNAKLRKEIKKDNKKFWDTIAREAGKFSKLFEGLIRKMMDW